MPLIKKLSLIFFLLSGTALVYSTPNNRWFTVMIDPAGDTHHTGRTIDNALERDLTLQAALELKQLLEERNKDVRAIITRTAGESIEPLQNASFANRLKTDLYCTINFFQTKSSSPSLFIYYLQKNKLTDDWYKPKSTLSFVPYNYAHTINNKLTKKLADNAYSALKKDYSHYFTLHAPLGLPFTPLIGIVSPALSFEISLSKKEDWKSTITPLVAILENCMHNIMQREGASNG